MKKLYPIKLDLNDVDGCMVKNGYDTMGDIQSGPDKETDGFFKIIWEYNQRNDNIPIILTSGRSLRQMKGIAVRSGNKNIIIHEHGMGIYNPETDVDVSIFDEVPGLGYMKDGIRKLAELKPILEDRFGNLIKELHDVGYKRVETIRMAPGKQFSIAIDLPYNGKFERSERVDGIIFYKMVWDEIPEEYKKLMFTTQKEVSRIVGKSGGLINAYVDSSAVNFRPPVSKPTSLKYILSEKSPLMRKYKVDPHEVALVDDRDIDSMKAMAGSIWAPADASEEVKREVVRRIRVDGNGYISHHNNIIGQLDILYNMAERNRQLHVYPR